ncbi:putative vacuolar protein sorting-associated protein 13A isoform X4 [Trypanosoma cruzi]|nr:putative vacuolar protein sorting-associated protein 13A isoform X4 [Trypanosoma cruzi]
MLFPAEINSPVFFDESVMIPSLEVLISCSNLSFDVLGESSGTWNLPLRFSCNGQESLLVEFKRFPDTHMNTTVTFGRCFLCSVDEFTLILPSYSNKGVLQLVMDWRPPMDLVKEENIPHLRHLYLLWNVILLFIYPQYMSSCINLIEMGQHYIG